MSGIYYGFTAIDDLATLKDEVGNSTSLRLILGTSFPTIESAALYSYDPASTLTGDDDEVVVPYSAGSGPGRWLKCDISQIKANWEALSGFAEILNKPTIPAAQVPADWGATVGPARILNKPALFGGSYLALSDKPTIPAAQVNADWGASTGLAAILNKPSIPAAQVPADWTAGSGPAQILNKPTIQAIQRARAQTNTSGVYTWTFPAAYGGGVLPIIGVTVEDATSGVSWNHQITAISNTSVTVQLVKTTIVTVLGLSVLGVAATPQAYVHLTAVAP